MNDARALLANSYRTTLELQEDDLSEPAAPLSTSRKAVIRKCRGGRTEHLMEPEWEGRSYAFMKCRWCGKREAV